MMEMGGGKNSYGCGGFFSFLWCFCWFVYYKILLMQLVLSLLWIVDILDAAR